MTENERIADELRRAWDGDAWHGPGLQRILTGITAEHAAARPVAGGHTIHELVVHLTTWNRAVARWSRGSTQDVMPEEDWPAPQSWEADLKALEASHRDAMSAAAAFPAGHLEETVPGREYNFQLALHGLAQHAAYHGGQIILLKRAQGI